MAGIRRVSEITRLASKDLISFGSLESVMAGLLVSRGSEIRRVLGGLVLRSMVVS